MSDDETPTARTAPPRKPTPQYEWQKARLKTPARKAPAGCILTRGYGPDGSYSLYLPTANAKRSIEFRGGKPQIVVVDAACQKIPAVNAAREWLLRCAARALPLAEILADVALVNYSAALLAVNYRLSDDDLGMLHSGGMWREPILKHAMGGEGAVEALRAIRPERIREIAMQAEGALTDAVLASEIAPSPLVSGVPVEPADSATVAAVAEIVAAGETLDDERAPDEFDPTDL
jgi:hypothetical protein